MPLKWELLRDLSGLFKLKMQCAVGGYMELRQCPWSLVVFDSNALGLLTMVLDERCFLKVVFENLFCLISVQ